MERNLFTLRNHQFTNNKEFIQSSSPNIHLPRQRDATETERFVIDIVTNPVKSGGAISHISMTDPPRPPTLQPISGSNHVSHVNDVIVSTPTHSSVPSLTNGNSVEEEEAFTIKCICQYSGDDGSTVLCESCNTWQHLDCYYEKQDIPGEDDVHSCVDCEPRILDARRANEIQMSKRADIDTIDRKIKRPVKSHKKKVKPLDSTLGVWNERHELGSPRNGIPKDLKKHKSGHKHSNSMHTSSNNGPKLVRRRSASQSLQSPPKGNDGLELTGEPYSEEFMRLYDDDPGESSMKANLLNNIAVTRDLATWSDDVDALASVTNGKKHPEVFLRTEPVETLPRPQLQKHIKEDTMREFHGRHPKWIYLSSESHLVKESFVGELHGKIGLMKDYVQEEVNRWEYLRHPLPFVFFHPILPIYIDTRNEGSLVRYLRRSCQPNLGLKTFLESGSDYRFGFVATKDIEAGAELTIPWTTDEHVRAFTQQNYGGIKSENHAETDENYILSYFSKVFADFGGCACEAPDECAINKLARRLRALTADMPIPNGKKRGRKPKDTAISRANASRSGSEAVRYKDDDDDEDDIQSTSTSPRSKSQSRDMTPQDSKPPAMGLEVSEREKRKIAAALERMDQDKSQSLPKKKKRISGPQNSTSKQDNSHKELIPARPRQVDASTGRKNSGSPTQRTTFSIPPLPRKASSSTNSPINNNSPCLKSEYVDSSTQTDPDPEDWFATPLNTDPPPLRRKFVSLKKKLLMRAHSERTTLEEKKKSAPSTPDQLSTPKLEQPTLSTQIPKDHDGDVVMENGQPVSASSTTGTYLIDGKSKPSDSPIEQKAEPFQVRPLDPPPVPHSTSIPVTNGYRNNDLRIPLPPQIMTSSIPSSTTTTQSPVVQSPSTLLTLSYGAIASPSPVKKMSLGDYISRRGSSLIKPETPLAGSGKDKDKEIDTECGVTICATPLEVKPVSSTTESPTEASNGGQNHANASIPQDLDAMEIDGKF